jgi:FkbM family methyltransferase
MQKITNLHRLDIPNTMLVLKYLLKRILHLKTSEKERQVNEYYFHLISFNGFLKQENNKNFVSYYPDFDATIKLRKRPSSDLNVFAQIYQYNEYKPLVETFKKHFPNDKKLHIIDAGSNIGLTSVYLSRHFPNSSFIAIEPEDSNFESVCFNLEANQVKNAIKIKGGLWSKNTNLKIVNDFRDQKDWSVRVEETNEEGDLKAFSIRHLMKEYHFEAIDILKIDIEGSEKEVFTGANADVSFLAKTKCIAIEIHDEFDCRAEINGILTRHNFRFYESGELTIGINQNFL